MTEERSLNLEAFNAEPERIIMQVVYIPAAKVYCKIIGPDDCGEWKVIWICDPHKGNGLIAIEPGLPPTRGFEWVVESLDDQGNWDGTWRFK